MKSVKITSSQLVLSAVFYLQDRTGVSEKEIAKFVSEKKGVPESQVKTDVKEALKKATKSGIFIKQHGMYRVNSAVIPTKQGKTKKKSEMKGRTGERKRTNLYEPMELDLEEALANPGVFEMEIENMKNSDLYQKTSSWCEYPKFSARDEAEDRELFSKNLKQSEKVRVSNEADKLQRSICMSPGRQFFKEDEDEFLEDDEDDYDDDDDESDDCSEVNFFKDNPVPNANEPEEDACPKPRGRARKKSKPKKVKKNQCPKPQKKKAKKRPKKPKRSKNDECDHQDDDNGNGGDCEDDDGNENADDCEDEDGNGNEEYLEEEDDNGNGEDLEDENDDDNANDNDDDGAEMILICKCVPAKKSKKKSKKGGKGGKGAKNAKCAKVKTTPNQCPEEEEDDDECCGDEDEDEFQDCEDEDDECAQEEESCCNESECGGEKSEEQKKEEECKKQCNEKCNAECKAGSEGGGEGNPPPAEGVALHSTHRRNSAHPDDGGNRNWYVADHPKYYSCHKNKCSIEEDKSEQSLSKRRRF